MKQKHKFLYVIFFLSLLTNASLYSQLPFSGGGDGSQTNPYILLTVADWNLLADSLNNEMASLFSDNFTYGKYFELGSDIAPVTKVVGLIITSNIYARFFGGHFDGKWHTITANININHTTNGSCGLFGNINGATIKNLIVDGHITTKQNVIGSIVGINSVHGYYNLIENCINLATLTAESAQMGGIVGGLSKGTIKNCINMGTLSITGSNPVNQIGGIISYINVGDTINLIKNVNISNIVYNKLGLSLHPDYNCYGGIVGIITSLTENLNFTLTMSECINIGSIVNVYGIAGGLVGMIDITITHITMSNNINYGWIRGQTNAGGIIGKINDNNCTIANCLNTGVIEGGGNIGAISGSGTGVTFINNHYDKQMCIYGGVNNVDVPGTTGHLTRDMVGTKLQALLGTADWTYTDAPKLIDRLYPQLKVLDHTEASKVGAAPVFLWDGIEGDD